MKATWTLFRRELRAHRLAFGVYFALTLLLETYLVLTVSGHPERFALGPLPLLGLLFFSPLMLAHAFAAERRNHLVYLLFALPVPRMLVGLVRVAANLVHTLGILGVSLLGTVVAYQRGGVREVTLSGSFVGLVLVTFLSLLLLGYGLVLGLETLRSLPLRGRTAGGVLSLFLGLYLASRGIAWGGPRILPAWTLTLRLQDTAGHAWQQTVPLQGLVFLALFGLLWGGLALWAFDRFAEV